jgi:Zn-dependent alcohol dehydrogenase
VLRAGTAELTNSASFDRLDDINTGYQDMHVGIISRGVIAF